MNMRNLLIRSSLATGNIITACCQCPQPVFSFVKPSFPWLPQEVQWFVATAGQGPLSCLGLRCGFQRWEGSSSQVMVSTCGSRINGLSGCMNFLTTVPTMSPAPAVPMFPWSPGQLERAMEPCPSPLPRRHLSYNWSGEPAFLLATLLKGSEHRLPCQGFCPDSRRTS